MTIHSLHGVGGDQQEGVPCRPPPGHFGVDLGRGVSTAGEQEGGWPFCELGPTGEGELWLGRERQLAGSEAAAW